MNDGIRRTNFSYFNGSESVISPTLLLSLSSFSRVKYFFRNSYDLVEYPDVIIICTHSLTYRVQSLESLKKEASHVSLLLLIDSACNKETTRTRPDFVKFEKYTHTPYNHIRINHIPEISFFFFTHYKLTLWHIKAMLYELTALAGVHTLG
jgi:hypothetical protein